MNLLNPRFLFPSTKYVNCIDFACRTECEAQVQKGHQNIVCLTVAIVFSFYSFLYAGLQCEQTVLRLAKVYTNIGPIPLTNNESYDSQPIKKKSNPITGLDRPRGFQESEAPRFQDNRHMKVVRLSAQLTGRLYPPGNNLGTHFC